MRTLAPGGADLGATPGSCGADCATVTEAEALGAASRIVALASIDAAPGP